LRLFSGLYGSGTFAALKLNNKKLAMKFLILLLALFTAGLFLEKRGLAVRDEESTSMVSARIYLCPPAFDPYKLRAGDAPVSYGLVYLQYPESSTQVRITECLNREEKKELISLNEISQPDSSKNLLIWETNEPHLTQEVFNILPENGWALMGLYNSLGGQDKLPEPNSSGKCFEEDLDWSDIKINDCRAY
jgi:hypothetical protein